MRRFALSALAFLMLAFAGLTAGSTPASAGECEYVKFADGSRREVNKVTGQLCTRWPPNTVRQQPYYPTQPQNVCGYDYYGNAVPCQPYYRQGYNGNPGAAIVGGIVGGIIGGAIGGAIANGN